MRGSWTLARRLRVALASFTVLVVVAIVAIVLVLREADQAVSDQRQRIFPARLAASQLLTSLVDQETALRGYALTRDKTFLEPYRRGASAEREVRRRLDTLIGPRDPARLSLLTVDSAITAWRDEYAALRPADIDANGPLATIEFGRELFNRIRDTSAALDDELAAEVRASREHADRDRTLVLWVLGTMSLLLLLGVVALQRALRSSVLGPMASLGRQVAEVSRGEHDRAIRPEGPPDLREMGAGVESMRQELVSAQQAVVRRAAELARSNADLEQFAYVASHDLQEPLRKVASFCQLLEQRYGEELDERGKQYIAFAVDGAKRMQMLITDLLMFSRVGRTSEGFEPVDLAVCVAKAWDGLAARVEETGAEVELDGTDLGVVGDQSLLVMLFANLLGNALKYHRPDFPPRVQVTTHREGSQLRVDVADNGIGIPEEYAEKVFVIFQRLHGRDQYEGTGIGLALCKKIVEFHGGTIELRSSPLGGACVSFTLTLQEVAVHA